MPHTYELVAGDSGAKLVVTCRDHETDEPIDLTGKTVHLRYSLNSGATLSRAMTVLPQATQKGQADYQFAPADLTIGGSLEGEVRLQQGLADQLTAITRFHIPVKMPLP